MKCFKRKLVLILIAMLIVLPGCKKQETSTRTTMRVGVVLYTQDDPYINALSDCLKENFEQMESDNFKIIMTVRDGKNDQSAQDDAVEEIIDAGNTSLSGIAVTAEDNKIKLEVM